MPDSPPLSIGIVLHDFNLGGTERIALRLAAQWLREGARVSIFCGSRQGPLAPLVPEGAEFVEASPPIVRGRRSRERLGRAAAAQFEARPVDVCFVPGNYHWRVVPHLARIRTAPRPAILACVTSALHKPQRGPIGQWLFAARTRRLLRHADAVTTLSRQVRDQADAMLRREIARVIPLPALPDEAPPVVPVPPGPPEILAAGRLAPEKGFATLIQAFARLPDPAARLTILGEGRERGRLEAQIERAGLAARVRLAGYVEDIRPWLDRSRLFVLSSQHEGFPAVLVEAIAAGRRLVTTDCTDAVADIPIDREAGRVVPIDDPAALAAAMAELLAEPPADPLRLAARVARYRIGPVARAYLDLFRELVARRMNAPASQRASIARLRGDK